MDLACCFYINVEFGVGFDGMLEFLGFEGDLGGSVVIFVSLKSIEMLGKSRVYRSVYRSNLEDFYVGIGKNLMVSMWNR